MNIFFTKCPPFTNQINNEYKEHTTLTLNIDDNRNRLLLSISKFQFVFRIKVKPADDGYWVVCFNFLYQ